MERCLKSVATTKAKEQFEKREPKMPGNSFVAQYLGAFRPREWSVQAKGRAKLT